MFTSSELLGRANDITLLHGGALAGLFILNLGLLDHLQCILGVHLTYLIAWLLLGGFHLPARHGRTGLGSNFADDTDALAGM